MIKTQSPKIRRLVTLALFSIALLAHGSANANWFVDNDAAVGFEGGNLNSGLSLKFPYSADTSWQLTLGGGGAGTGIGGRYLSYFSESNEWRFYWYGGVSINSWGGNYGYRSETYVGLSGGVGADYDLSNIEDFPLPISINFTVGPTYAAFSDYQGFDLLSFGMGLHYRFK